MAVLTTKKRNNLKSSTFGLPKERKYPMPDKAHARNAKARASQMVKKGKLSSAQKKVIDSKADRILNNHLKKSDEHRKKKYEHHRMAHKMSGSY